MTTKTLVNKKDQLINFINKNEGKLVSIEFSYRMHFSMVSINSLHVQKNTGQQISLSDLKDDPEYLTKSKISSCNIYKIDESGNELEVQYEDGSKILISIY
jgi:hypothetical protein